MKNCLSSTWAKRRKLRAEEEADLDVGIDLLTDDPWVVSKPNRIADPEATETILEEVYAAELRERLVQGLNPQVAVITPLRYKVELSAREIFTNPTVKSMGIEKKKIPGLLRAGEEALRERLPQLLH